MQARMTHPVVILPDSMTALIQLNASAEAELPLRTRQLVHLRASQINGCSVCVDMHARELFRSGAHEEHIFAVAAWRDTPFFTEAERAALELTEALTRLADISDPVPDPLWRQVSRHFDEKQIASLLINIAQINLWNRMNVAVRQMVAATWEQAA
jgi:AhpD family alkylhydroperoxidase